MVPVTRSVAIVNGDHPEGNTFIVVGPMSMNSVRELIAQMLHARDNLKGSK